MKVACGRALTCLIVIALCGTLHIHAQSKSATGVRVVPNESARRVDVFVDGQPFTSYIWPDTIKKPVLYPLRTAMGTPITRGYPLEPRAGERTDHPHQVGLWLNYGDVNGYDFWNNSDAIKPEERKHYGTIRHVRIKRVASGKARGELEVETEWLAPDGRPLLREETLFVFSAAANRRAVERITKLTALDQPVVFNDNKEGLFGLRVARQLEQPSNEPSTFTDASGKPTVVAKMDNAGVSGQYRSSEGKTGDAVWGTRGRWASLAGHINEETITLVMIDHPQNPGYPTYWHARGYGLFAANPLGQKIFSNGKQELKFTLSPRQSATFRYQLLILSGDVTPALLESEAEQFSKKDNR
ncbi:MAG: PmoA family protein [Blastocatellia bacterium]